MSKHIFAHGKLFLSVVLSLSFLICLCLDSLRSAETVRNECLRLHVLAASDSPEDQAVKLLVRDELLRVGEEIFSGSSDARKAAERIYENKGILEEAANNVLRENGFSYKAHLTMEKEYFETRQYEDVSLPAGQYNACKVILGEGEGQNWWCVMFPPMCLPCADKDDNTDVLSVFGEDGTALVTQRKGYKIKFRIVEIVEELIEEIRQKTKN